MINTMGQDTLMQA